jgi:epoxyqueuosine reductase
MLQTPTDTKETGSDPFAWMKLEIQTIIRRWTENHGGKNYWREPFLACAATEDPLFQSLGQAVAPDHATPGDLLSGARSVLVFFLPFLPILGRENSNSGFFSSRDWAESYVATNRLIADINAHLQTCFEAAGHRAAVTPATHNFDEKRLISRWSHKHLALIAGLGTFGLHHLLITQAGCCGRLGSLVTTMQIPPTPRPEEEWCLAKAGHRCSECVTRCTYGALQTTGLDRHACYDQCLRTDKHYSDLPTVDVCGKCGCEVPCSYEIPLA